MRDVTTEILLVGVSTGEVYMGHVENIEESDKTKITHPIALYMAHDQSGRTVVQFSTLPPFLPSMVANSSFIDFEIVIPNNVVRYVVKPSDEALREYYKTAVKVGYTTIVPGSASTANIIDITRTKN